MSDTRRIVEIYADVESNARKTLSGANLVDPTSQELYRGTQVLFRCHLKRADATAYTPNVLSTWLFGIDSVFTTDHDDLVVSATDQFNIDGDWDERDIAGGKICWRADLTSSALKTDLGSSSVKTMYAYLWMCPPSGSYTLMAQWDILVRNIAVDPTTASTPELISYPTIDLYTADLTQLRTPTGGIYRIKNGALQFYNADQNKFHTVSVFGPAGSEAIAVGPGED